MYTLVGHSLRFPGRGAHVSRCPMRSPAPRCGVCSAMVSSAEKGLSYENDTFTIGTRTGIESEVRCVGRGWPASGIHPVPSVRDARKAGDSSGGFNIREAVADEVADGGSERHAASSYAGTERAHAAHRAGRALSEPLLAPGGAPAGAGRDRDSGEGSGRGGGS